MKPNDLSSTAVVDLTAIQTAIEELQPLFGGKLALWRGHRDFGWKLQPHVFRPAAVVTRSDDEVAPPTRFPSQGAFPVSAVSKK